MRDNFKKTLRTWEGAMDVVEKKKIDEEDRGNHLKP